MRPFTLSIFSARLMTVTGKIRLPIGRLSSATNRLSEFSSHSHESRTKKSQYKHTFRIISILEKKNSSEKNPIFFFACSCVKR